MKPDLRITGNTMSAALAVAVISSRGEWADDVLEVAVEALEYAKANAPWANRTGEARSGLDVDVTDEGNEIVLSMYHTVPYGEWLETIQNARFAIIMPTLELYGPEIKRRIEGR